MEGRASAKLNVCPGEKGKSAERNGAGTLPRFNKSRIPESLAPYSRTLPLGLLRHPRQLRCRW